MSKEKDLTKLLKRSLFVPHRSEEIDPNEELGCYLDPIDALKDTACEFVTEVLVVRSINKQSFIDELEAQGVEIGLIGPIEIEESDSPVNSKQVIALMALAKKKKCHIKDLIRAVIGEEKITSELTDKEAEAVLEHGEAFNMGTYEASIEEEPL